MDIAALARLGLLTSVGGKVRLKAAWEYPDEAWDPVTAHPLTTWECAPRLVRALTAEKGGAEAAARIIRRQGGKAEEARAYLLYTEADKRGCLDDAQGYNALVAEWGDAQRALRESGGQLEQGTLGME